MRYILVLAILLTCRVPRKGVSLNVDQDPSKRAVTNKIKIKGDSNHVEINYYWYQYRIDSIKRDTVNLNLYK